MSKVSIRLTVNGRDYKRQVPARETLLSLLRDDLGLTGTKEGCGNGNCGACTVILNGEAVNSCLVLAAETDGGHVTTIEGLAGLERGTDEGDVEGRLDPLQRAFIECGAVQCGFCTPGMIMAAKALLNRNLNPSESEIRRALAGNLCRCTGYDSIVAAVRRTYGEVKVKLPQGSELMGRRISRIEAVAKVTGASQFAADIQMPNALIGKILFPPYAHANILRIDSKPALALSGVRAVITAADFEPHSFGLRHDREVLAREKVLFSGHFVAAVAAEEAETAEAALDLIKVDYEQLPGVFEPLEAMKIEAPLLRESQDYFEAPELGIKGAGKITCETGVVEQGFAQADLIFEDTFVTQRVHQSYLEPHACVARPEADGGITVWTGTQSPFGVRAGLASVLKLPLNRVRVIPTVVGGAFGGKIEMLLEPLAAQLARQAGKPVKMVLSRREELIASQTRDRNVLTYKTGVKRDGTILACEGRFVFDMGACGDDSESVTYLGSGVYRIPNLRLTGISVYTNHIPSSPFRAPKVPQLMFALESQMDRIARRLGLDPLELRCKNLISEGGTWPNGLPVGAVAVKETLERAAERAGWNERRLRPTPEGRLIGWGLACAPWPIWMSSTSTAEVILNEDGSIEVVTGAVDLTGTHTALAQLVAHELGINVERVSVTLGDTSTVPFNDTAAGSRTLPVTGAAVLRAVGELRRQLCETYALSRSLPVECITVQGGMVCSCGKDEARQNGTGCAAGPLNLGEVARLRRELGLGPAHGVGVSSGLPPVMAFATQIAQVEVDPETGRVRVLRLITAQDVGQAVNPALVEGQMSGGATQGIGFGLFEKHLACEGRVLNPTLLDYRLPTALDVPAFENIIVNGPPSAGPYGARGAGEPSICPTAASIANAVYDAIGEQIKELPLSPERVLN
ncbi:MAG: molybdopterin-dependent oxidoreductase, partial [Spirochaetota bacterium]